MSHIVAVANVGQANAAQVAEPLLQGEIVCQRLAGMLQITEGVDDRNGSELRHALDGLLREGAQHDDVYPALEIVRNVAQLLAGVESSLGLIDKHCRASEASHSSFEGKPGS